MKNQIHFHHPGRKFNNKNFQNNFFNNKTNQYVQESSLNQSLFIDSSDSGQEQLTGEVEKYFGCMLCLGFFSRNEMYSLTECEHLVCKSCGQNELKKAKGKKIRCHCKAFINTRPNQQKIPEAIAKCQNKINVKHQTPESRIDQQQCKICSQFHHKTSFLSIYECKHESCQNCLKNFVKNCIDNSKQIKCSHGCGSGYNLGSNFINKLDQKYQVKFKNLQFIWFTQKQGLKRCPSQKCNEGILIELLEFYECSSCFKRYCISCEWPQHRGACSSAADNYIDNYLLFAQCLKCKSKIQKNNGCNHMQCRCGHNFCYQCLGNWSSDHICPINNKRKFTIQVKNENINHLMTESILETQVNKRAKILGLELQDAKSYIKDRGIRINNWQDDQSVNQIVLVNRRVRQFYEQDREQRRRKYEEGLEKQLEKMTYNQYNRNLQYRPEVIKNHQLNLSIKDKCTQDHIKDIFDYTKNSQITQGKYKPVVKQKVQHDIRGQQSSIENHQKRYEKPKINNLAHLISNISF